MRHRSFDLHNEGVTNAKMDILECRLSTLDVCSAVRAPGIVKKAYKGCLDEEIDHVRKGPHLGFIGDCITCDCIKDEFCTLTSSASPSRRQYNLRLPRHLPCCHLNAIPKYCDHTHTVSIRPLPCLLLRPSSKDLIKPQELTRSVRGPSTP